MPFEMPAFSGQHKTIELGDGEQVHVLKNFDGQQGGSLAQALQSCYGLDILEVKGIGAKCVDTMGNNCQDDYSKLYPSRMFLDVEMGELNTQSSPSAWQRCDCELAPRAARCDGVLDSTRRDSA